MSKKYHNKDEKKLLIAILDKYIKENGDHLIALDAYQFLSLDPSLFETVPRITKEKIQDRQNSDSRYFKSLELKKYISKNGHPSPYNFYLTQDGYHEGKRLKSPVKYFLIKHWKFFTGLTVSLATATLAIIRYLQC